MSMKNGGPAFPRGPIGEDCDKPFGQQEGMNLRDYVAAKVFAAITVNGTSDTWEGDAKVAFKAADAFIAARTGGPANG